MLCRLRTRGLGTCGIDAVVREITEGTERYDKAGMCAAHGTPYQPLIDAWLKHPFFQLQPPKTTGREMFGNTFAMECLEACRSHRLADNGHYCDAHRIDCSDDHRLHSAVCSRTESDRRALRERWRCPQPNDYEETW